MLIYVVYFSSKVELDSKLEFKFPEALILALEGEGDEYGLNEEMTDEFEENFGEEVQVRSEAVCREMLKYLSPAVVPEEMEQWVALYSHDVDEDAGNFNENFLSGIASGEQVNRAYTVHVTPPPATIFSAPSRFRILHRDASGECLANGNIGVFVHYQDPAAIRGDFSSTFLLASGSYASDLEWKYFVSGAEMLVTAILLALKDPTGRSRDSYLR